MTSLRILPLKLFVFATVCPDSDSVYHMHDNFTTEIAIAARRGDSTAQSFPSGYITQSAITATAPISIFENDSPLTGTTRHGRGIDFTTPIHVSSQRNTFSQTRAECGERDLLEECTWVSEWRSEVKNVCYRKQHSGTVLEKCLGVFRAFHSSYSQI